MGRCVNENCEKDPLRTMGSVIVNCDGDMACCPTCKDEYKKQKDKFLNETIHDDKKFSEWLGVPKELL